MELDPVFQAIKSRRAIRSYESKPVPQSAIDILLEAAIYAPTAINIQPWKFSIITNKEAMRNISDIAKPLLLGALPDVVDEGLARFKGALASAEFNVFYDAPLAVFISGDKSQFAVNDCSMAAQNMMLVAYTLGLGSCWIGSAIPAANTPKIKAELGVPEDHQVYAVLIFGYPKNGFPAAPEKKPPQILKRID